MLFAKSPTETQLDAEITTALEKLATLDKTSENYGKLVEHIARLHKLKIEERPKRISPDAALIVAANVFGILWVARYERDNVISRNAFGLIMRPHRS